MATSSIFVPVNITDDEEAKIALEALAAACETAEKESKHPRDLSYIHIENDPEKIKQRFASKFHK